MRDLLTIIRYEIHTTLRQSSSMYTPLLFFVIVLSLFSFALGPDNATLIKFAPGIIWVAALLAILLSMSHLFQTDAHEGYLDLMLQSPYPLTWLVICKLFSHWLMYCLPLILISPLFGFLLHFTAHEEYALMVSLLLGTPVLILLGAIGSALMVGIHNQGLLLPILILPLYIPVLIFGTQTLENALALQPISADLAIMGALLLLSLAFAPLMTAIALRIGASQ